MRISGPMLDNCYIPVARELKEVETILAGLADFGVDLVDIITRHAIDEKGKRIRPAVSLLAASACGIDMSIAVPIGAAIEMLHTATLLHDDVVDDSLIRRGEPSIKMRWGNQASVLIGDLLWSKAIAIFLNTKNQKLIETANNSIAQIIRGELLEMAYANNLETEADVCLEIIGGKTGELFSMAAASGTIAANLEGPYGKALSEYGMYLGKAFQLVDDTMDYAADEKTLGKTPGQDLRKGRLTYPLVLALGRADDTDRKKIREAVMSKKISFDQFLEISQIVKETGGINDTLSLANNLCKKARLELDIFKPSPAQDALRGITQYVISRF